MNPRDEVLLGLTRRHFLARTSNPLGWAVLAALMAHEKPTPAQPPSERRGTARQVIFLHMVGGPPQLDLFDHKPQLRSWADRDLPDSVRGGQRLTTQTSGQARLPIEPSRYEFAQHGRSGMWVSELLPWTARMVDDLCFVRSMHTDAINHDPAVSLLQTGSQVAGQPALGAWLSYGLGSLQRDLPTFAVLVARSTSTDQAQAIGSRLWSAGFLPGEHAGVMFRRTGAAMLYLDNPPGVPSDLRRLVLDGLGQLNEMHFARVGDPETRTRIQQYEMAFRMQTSVPELTDLSSEPESTFRLYGEDARRRGSFANTALMARRLIERGVRVVQIYHNHWDVHNNLAYQLPTQCSDVDQGCYGLIQDLKRRGLLDSTLVVWGGEFGRTVYCQGRLGQPEAGRDHHPRCFTMWLAGGGVRPGTIYGETDDYSYNIVKDPVAVRDLHATMLHLMGLDHERLTFRFQGLDQRLTGVERAEVVRGILA